jgi:diketogulonate reductase-like aldo/keto reductase
MGEILTIDSTIELNNGTNMPQLGFGVYQIPTGKQTVETVSWALKAGYRHIDTAKFYKNEVSVGEAIRKSGIARDKIWVTTKLWPTDFINIEKAFETSLAKLDIDYIDLYLVHFPIPGTIKKVWNKMETIYKTGKVKAIGVSNYGVDHLQDTLNHASIPPSVNQMRCSVFGYNKDVYRLCQKQNIAFEAYSPLTQGKQLNNPEVSLIAEQYDKTTAQIMLRWALQKNIVVIPKSQTQTRIVENTKIFDFEISDEDMKALDLLSE